MAPTCPRTRPRFAAAPAQLLFEEAVQRLFLTISAEPQRLAGFQIARHRQELLLLAEMDFIDAQLPQRRPFPLRRPALEITQIDGSHRTLGEPEPARHLPRRRSLARLSHRLFEAFAERCFARQLVYALDPRTALWTAQPI